MPRTLSLVPLALALLLTPLVPTAAVADDGTLTPRRLAPEVSPPLFSVLAGTTAGGQCADGIVYDDGTVEDGLSFTADTLDLVMRFDLGTPGARLDEVCVCWTRAPDAMSGADLPYEVVVYDVAAGGEPGELLGLVQQTAEDVPEFMDSRFYSCDVSDEDLVIPGEQAYVGVSWFANSQPEFFLCTDDNGDGAQPLFFSTDLGSSWMGVREFPPGEGADPDSLSRIDALMIRTQVEAPSREPFVCAEDETTLCLADDRFEVKVDWATSQGTEGVGMAEELTADTGYFWFFEKDNVELVIKVLDACTFPTPRFWVFAGGLTNVEVDITVTDSFTGQARTFRNPQQTPFQPIQDTNAFDTCDATPPP